MRKFKALEILTGEALSDLNANVQELEEIVAEVERVRLELSRMDLSEEELKRWLKRGRDVLVKSKTVRKY